MIRRWMCCPSFFKCPELLARPKAVKQTFNVKGMGWRRLKIADKQCNVRMSRFPATVNENSVITVSRSSMKS